MEEKKTRKFKYTKLVRDNIVDQMIKNGAKVYYTELDVDDFVHELKLKLLEETMEVPESTREELIQELADIQEVIDNLTEALNVKKDDLRVIQEKKREKVGSFNKRLYVDFIEIPEDSEWIKFYLDNSGKYPEIQ